ncbi:MAG: rhodanese-like domain-containing protein [Desulfobacterales bacterium]
MKTALWQAPALVALAVLIALAANHWRSDGIALVGAWSVDARFADAAGDSLVIGLEEAERLFHQNAALFVDARPQSQYADGHIRGALSLPWQDADRYFIELVDQLEGARTLITYCDGESCDLSHELALFLKEMGFENVRVLVNGWTVWQQAGLPLQMEE